MNEKKSVSDLIFDKFAGKLEADRSFEGICADLVNLVRQKRPGKAEIEAIFRRRDDEDTQS